MKRATAVGIWQQLVFFISIHALVKRATSYEEAERWLDTISIHALVKRATHCKSSDIDDAEISIHALVKRATVLVFSLYGRFSYFNPRPREEGDQGF